LSADAEPSARQVAGLICQIQREKITAVFVESMSNPKLLTQLRKNAGVTVAAALSSDALSGCRKAGRNRPRTGFCSATSGLQY